MERYRFLALSLPLVAAAASAQETTLQTESARLMGFFFDNYLTIFGGILLLFLVFSGLNRLLKRRYGSIEFLAMVFGVLFALILIGTGFLLLATTSVLAWATAIKDLSYLDAQGWAVPIAQEVQALITPLLDAVFQGVDYTALLQNLLLGVMLIGGGLGVFLGVVILWKLPKGSFYEIVSPGGSTTFKEVMKRGHEPLAPTVTFKVIDRISNQPSPDIKVILKHKEGAKVYTRYTDFNGEVVFQKIDGLYSQYYAYVEGDEERKRYWVIRTSIGAESVT